MGHELGYDNVINDDTIMVTLIWNELYEPNDNNWELKNGKPKLNLDRGRVEIIYVG
jgi:exonuclease I